MCLCEVPGPGGFMCLPRMSPHECGHFSFPCCSPCLQTTASLGLGAWVIAEPRHILVLSDHVTLRLCEAGVCDSFCCLPPYLQKHKLQRAQCHAVPTLQTPLLLQAVITLSSIPQTQGSLSSIPHSLLYNYLLESHAHFLLWRTAFSLTVTSWEPLLPF